MEQLRVVEFVSLEALMELLQMGRLLHGNFVSKDSSTPSVAPWGSGLLELGLKKEHLWQSVG